MDSFNEQDRNQAYSRLLKQQEVVENVIKKVVSNLAFLRSYYSYFKLFFANP